VSLRCLWACPGNDGDGRVEAGVRREEFLQECNVQVERAAGHLGRPEAHMTSEHGAEVVVVRYAQDIVRCAEAGDDQSWPSDIVQKLARAHLALTAKLAEVTAKVDQWIDINAACGIALEAAEARAKRLEAEVTGWRECALYDACMDGPKFKGWNRSALDRMRLSAALDAP